MAGAKWGFGLLEETPGEFAKLDDGLYKVVKRVFKLRRANPETQQETGKMFEAMANKVTYRNFVKCLKGGVTWNINDIETHLELNKLKNTRVLGFHPAVIAKFGLVPEQIPEGTFANDLDEGIEA